MGDGENVTHQTLQQQTGASQIIPASQSQNLFFSVLTLSGQVVMVVMVNEFGVTGDERDCCSLGYLMTRNLVRMKKSSSWAPRRVASTRLVVLQGVETLPVALNHRGQVLV